MAKLTRAAASSSIGLKGWSLDALDKAAEYVSELVREAAREVLELAFNASDVTDRPYIYLPIEWGSKGDGIGGDPDSDLLAVYLRIPLMNDNELEMPTWRFSFGEAIDDVIEGGQCGDGAQSEEGAVVLVRLRDALVAQVAKIDAAIATAPASGTPDSNGDV